MRPKRGFLDCSKARRSSAARRRPRYYARSSTLQEYGLHRLPDHEVDDAAPAMRA